MEYATEICNDAVLDSNSYKYIGWQGTESNRSNYNSLFDINNLTQIQKKITELLRGVDPKGRPIIVPIKTISSVLSECYQSNSPVVGDIHSRFIIEGESTRNDCVEIVDRTIQIIVSQIRNEIETVENNNKLTIWNSLYGDFNKHGLRGHSGIKLNKRRPSLGFYWNY
jgi:hypothetical protein